MAKKHLIALDLDGTLLTNEKTISPKTKKVLRKAREQGHEIMIATGRPFRSSEMYYHELNLNTPIVNFNGAFVHHPKNAQWGTHHAPLDIAVVRDIVETLHSYTFYNIVAEVIDDVYLHNHDVTLFDVFGYGNPKITIGDLRRFLNDSPTSLLIHTDEEHIGAIRNHLSTAHAEVIEHRSWANPWHVIEIVRSGLNKAIGIKRASNYLQIPPERIIAFGDEDNDLEMLEFAGHGIAMGNAIDSVKTIADDVTVSNQEDGFAVYLNDYLNLKAL